MEGIEKKSRVCDRPYSKYGFGDLEVGHTIEIIGDLYTIRQRAIGFMKKWGTMFLVTKRSGGKVEIKRYK